MMASGAAMDRTAPTDRPILDLLARRWSPRAFSDRPVDPATLATLFEAARWAPSSYNEQPWRFIVATMDDPAAYQRVLGCLAPFNQEWARTAPVLVITVAALRFAKNGKDNAHARHDIGLAMMALTIQAQAMEIYVHQMAGFDPVKTRADLGIPDDFEPVSAAAIGYQGDPAVLNAKMREQEIAPRERRALDQSVFSGSFATPATWAG